MMPPRVQPTADCVVVLTIEKKPCTVGQQVHENVLNIINHQGNANQSYREISPLTGFC